MRKNTVIIALVLACAVAHRAWAWDGSGTTTDPYLINSTADWQQLAEDVTGGETYSGTVFRMTVDIDAGGVSVGADDKPFSGIFDGDGHTLTYNRGESNSEGVTYDNDICAPFIKLIGATIRHLKVTGSIYSSHMHCAGLASLIEGSQATTILDCHVSSLLQASDDLLADACFGGLVGSVPPIPTATTVIKDCTFTGAIDGAASRSSCFVGYTNWPIAFTNCIVDYYKKTGLTSECATFVRMAPDVECTFDECYYTAQMGVQQGKCMFTSVVVPDGCTVEIISKPKMQFNGKNYCVSGAQVLLTVPEEKPFDHWMGIGVPGCFINDPWKASGIHTLTDVRSRPVLEIFTEMPTPKMEREMDGTKYRYLSRNDYSLYLSQEYCDQKGYYLDDGWLVKMVGSTKVYVTAVTGWIPGNIPEDGAQIHNDLSGYFHDYTLMACIAPHAFQGCQELKTLYFKDTDATSFEAQTDFDFVIGDYAFANCGNLTEVKMMQYTTKGDNHWEALTAAQVSHVGDSVFHKSPQAHISVDASQFQDYMNSETWRPLWTRLMIYNHTDADFTSYGASYGYWRNTAGEALKNNAEGHNTSMESLRYWNTTFKNFNAADVLAEADFKNIWYTHIVGVDAEYLNEKNGVMRIYNDPGQFYNYKTLCVDRHAFKDCTELKAIEFWQTDGRSGNSYSDLKMVIQNGAFQGCTNLKELRMFYKAQDGDERWITLGPQDVVPGDNIFGIPTAAEYEVMSSEEREHCNSIPKDFKILVATDRFDEFLADPNWMTYIPYIEPVEYDPGQMNHDFVRDKLTYGYLTSAGGIMRTSQTVSQDLSWWSALRLTWEVISWATTIKGWFTAAKEVSQAAMTEYALAEGLKNTSASLYATTAFALAETGEAAKATALRAMLQQMQQQGLTYTTSGLLYEGNREFFNRLALAGIINNGVFTGATNLTDEALVGLGMTLKEELLKSTLTHTTTAATQGALMNKLWWESMTKTLAFKQPGKYAVTTTLCTALFGTWAKYKETTQGQPTLTDGMLKGMRNNLLANIHQWGSLANGLLYATPTKNLVYHTYLKSVADDVSDARINVAASHDQGMNAFAVTMNMSKTAFHNKTNVQKIRFYDNGEVSSNVGVGMCFTIPDSAFLGCTNLRELRLILDTEENGSYALGPENFILGGDDIFADVDTTQLRIVVDASRYEDFINNESWAPFTKCFTCESARPQTQYTEYGVEYAYAYEMNTIKKEHKKNGHLVEHTVINGADNEYLDEHSGAAILINDIGVWNNYQLDRVSRWAFRNNQSLRRVLFADLKGWAGTGKCYSDVDITLDDSCFVGCKNLEFVDLLYMVTDQKDFVTQIGSWSFESNHLAPLTPQQVKIGKDVFANSPKARLKMMPQQVAWFEADSTWAKYSDRFLPVVFHTEDEGVAEALEDLIYSNPSGFSPDEMDEYIDLSLVLGKAGGFNWLSDKFREKDEIYSFADFKLFEHLGLNYVGTRWFFNCTKMNRITLPSTIQKIRDEAFKGCTALTDIELPANVTLIENEVFAGCTSLKDIIVHSTTPPTLLGTDQFPTNEGMRIYVPDESLDLYLNDYDWRKYRDYITGQSNHRVSKVVTVTEPGQLAEKLGLNAVVYDKTFFGEQFKSLEGYIEPYDSLTVIGPINGLDLVVLRYLAGCDSYVDNGALTDGRLRYLNLANADIRQSGHIVYYDQYVLSTYRYKITEDNSLPPFAFAGCTKLETLILPKSLKSFDKYCFYQCDNLRQLAIGGKDLVYDQSYAGKLLSSPLEELVFYTETTATCSHSEPWGVDINNAYTLKSQLGDYMTQVSLNKRVHNFLTPFEDDVITTALFDKGEYFPSSYLMREEVEGLFQGNSSLTNFDEFFMFEHVKRLDKAFKDCDQLRTIFLPTSVESIGAEAFDGCVSLDTIRLVCDSVPLLAPDAFASLPASFRIIVPKSSCKLYRTKWPQYADHINVDDSYYADDDIIEVTLTEPNTLAEKLGLTVTRTTGKIPYINSIHGDYSNIRRLKVSGPISGNDFDVMKYLAGYCTWARTRNLSGHLEYIDLYDARVVKSTYTVGIESGYKFYALRQWEVNDNEFPRHAFLKCYPLKTLILPRTCKSIKPRALQESEGLETLVVGDDTEEFNWNALDDDASLTRMYILAKKKLTISADWHIWDLLCNNYNPTFDAFYVRPSLYNDYLADDAYTGSSWQRTNNVSKGEFDDDDSFCAFAVHAAATQDDLANVTDVKGWFDSHPDAKNLKALAYTSIDSLHKETLAPLTKLAEIALPATLKHLPENVFGLNSRLQSVDLLQSSSTDLLDQVRKGGFTQIGIDTLQTLIYLPADYGKSNGTNIVVVDEEGGLHTRHYNLKDDFDYLVPYPFKADTVTFAHRLNEGYLDSFCLPFRPDMPAGAKVYEVDTREGSAIIFKEVTDELQPLKPYLVLPLTVDVPLMATTKQTIPASGGRTIGQTENFYTMTAFRGTLETVDKETAQELPAYVVNEDVTAMDDDFCSTGTWKAADGINPFTAFLLPGANGTFTLKLKDSGKLLLQDAADNQPLLTRYNGKTVDTATLQGRTLYKDGLWNTLCLPFDVSTTTGPLSGDGVQAMVLRSSDSGLSGTTLKLNFDAATSIPAGTPFIIKWGTTANHPDTDLTDPEFTGVTVSNATNDVTFTGGAFKGTYKWQEYTTEDKSILFLGGNNKLYYPQPSGSTIPNIGACRAYFKLSDGADARNIVLTFGDDDAMGIATTNYTNSDDAWYDLQGRKIENRKTVNCKLPAGLYINNGRKVMIK